MVQHAATLQLGTGTIPDHRDKLVEEARERGVAKFTADVMQDNARMLHIFHKCAPNPISSTLESGIYHLSFSILPGDNKKKS